MNVRFAPRRLSSLAIAAVIAVLGTLITVTPASAVDPLPGSISGVVTRSTGAVASGVTVQAIELGTDLLPLHRLTAVTTSSTGAFTIPSVAIGTYTLLLSGASGHFTQYLGGSQTVAGSDTFTVTSATQTYVRAALEASGTAKVTVKGLTGAVVSGVVVRAYSQSDEGDWISRGTATTNTYGIATIAGLAPGVHRLGISSATGKVPRLFSGNVARISAANDVVIDKAKTTSYTFTVPTTGTVTGTLQSGATPLVGIPVRLYSLTGNPGSFSNSTRTDITGVSKAGGLVSITGVPAGYYAMRFEPSVASGYGVGYAGDTTSAYASAASHLVTVVAGGTASLGALQVSATGSVSGYARSYTPDGDFAPWGVPVFAWPLYDTPEYVQKPGDELTTTDGTGHYTITGLAAGTWTIMVGTRSPEFQINPNYNAYFSPYGQNVTVTAGLMTIAPQSPLQPISATELPSETAPISASGTANVGETLTVTPATYDQLGEPSPAQWLRDGKAIPGATGDTYTLSAADYNHLVSVRQTTRFSRYTQRTAVSTPQGIGEGPAATRDGSDRTTGALVVGSAITANPGVWSMPNTISYEWCLDVNTSNNCDDPFDQIVSTSATYTPDGSTIGRRIFLTIRSTRLGYQTSTVGGLVGTVGLGSFNQLTGPSVSKVNGNYVVNPGTYTPTPGSVVYQWQVGGATPLSWDTLSDDDNSIPVSSVTGQRVQVIVQNGGGGVLSTYDILTVQLGTPGAATGAITLPATLTPPQNAEAPVATWPADPGGTFTPVSFQWQYKSGLIWKNYVGQTGQTMALNESHVGKSIRVIETAETFGFAKKSFTTNAATVLPMAAPVATGPLSTNFDSAAVGTALANYGATWDTPSVVQSYYWKYKAPADSAWKTISGATSSTFKVTEAYFGKQLLAGTKATKTGHIAGYVEKDLGTVTAGVLTTKSAGKITLSSGKYMLSLPTAVQGATVNTIEWYRVDKGTLSAAHLDTYSGKTSVPASAALENTFLWAVVVQRRTGYSDLVVDVFGAVQNGLSLNVVFPAITSDGAGGNPQVGKTLTVSNGVWNDPQPTSYTYEWYYIDAASYKKIAGATSSTFLVPNTLFGKIIQARVIAHRGGFSNVTALTADTDPVISGDTPVAGTLPSVSGTTAVGSVLTGSNGAGWDVPGLTYTYEWKRTIGNVVVATTKNYTPTKNDRGSALRFTVTASKPGYTPAQIAQDTDVVVQGTLLLVKSPVVTKSGSTLTVNVGTWSPTISSLDWAVQWYVYDRATGAPSDPIETKTLNAASYPGAYVTAKVYVGKDGYADNNTTVLAQKGRAAAFTGSDTLEVFNDHITAFEVAQDDQWDLDADTTNYVWKRNGVAIAGAPNDYYYTLQSADTGAVLSVTITKVKAGYTTGSKTFSTPTPIDSIDTIASVTKPAISGTAAVGGSLTGTKGTWTVPSLSYSYQWWVNEPSAAPIPNATSATWTPTAAYAGRAVELRVTASKKYYAPVTVASAPVVIAYGAAATGSTPTITTMGDVLTAKQTTVSAGFTVTLQWYTVAGGVPTEIGGATGSTLTATPGITYRVVYTAKRTGHTTSTFTSADVTH